MTSIFGMWKTDDADGNIDVCPLATVPVSIRTVVEAMKKLSDMR